LGLVCASSEIVYGLDETLLKSDRESCFNALNNYLELPQDRESNLVNESLELVIIDSQIADSQTLIDNLSGAAEVIILDEQTNGLQQITNALSQYEDVKEVVKENFKAIHLVSHGDVGQLFLGNTQLNTNNLSQYTELLATWNDFLTEDADILLYGCELGATNEGIAFLEKFSQLTNTDILASNDATGSSLLNGDWDLEVAVGNVETEVIFNSNIAETYNHTLVGSTFGELRLIDNANLILESDLLNPNTFDIGDLGISFTNLNDLDDLLETGSFAGIKDGYLQFELLDIHGDFVVIETNFTDVDYSFLDNPYNFSFDGDFYLANNPDVAKSGQNPFLHYMQTGWKESRNPSAFFSTKYYLDKNADVRNSGKNPLEHFYSTGWKEGRNPSQFFDTTFYLELNADVRNANINPLEHYNTSGWKEFRNPSPYFNTKFYLAENNDVFEAQVNPLEHFNTSGWKEFRNPNQFFDMEFYLASNPDVANAKTNPLGQYINTGWKEGRNPSPFFDGKYYLNKYVDVAKSGLGPLEHFNISGFNENRLPSRPFESPDQILIAQNVYTEANPTSGSDLGLSPTEWILIGGTIKFFEDLKNGIRQKAIDFSETFVERWNQFNFVDSQTGTPPFPGETETTIQIEVFPNGKINDVVKSDVFTFPVDGDGNDYTILSTPKGNQILENIIGSDVLTFPGQDEIVGSYFLSIDRDGNSIGYNVDELSNFPEKNNGLSWQQLIQQNGKLDIAGEILPIRRYQGNLLRTHGVFRDINNTAVGIPFSSGESSIGNRVREEFKNAGTLDLKITDVLTHAEGHAAATIRTYNLDVGTIYINHRSGPCSNCLTTLPRILNTGQKLNVLHLDMQGRIILDRFTGGTTYNQTRDRSIVP
jgi:hypothetical protein